MFKYRLPRPAPSNQDVASRYTSFKIIPNNLKKYRTIAIFYLLLLASAHSAFQAPLKKHELQPELRFFLSPT